MIRLQDRIVSLSDLLEERADLRRQELLVRSALHEVQREVKSWQQHRQASAAAGQPMPRELCLLWDELAERERELALDLLQLQSALHEANAEIARNLARPSTKAG